jgi:hypothetical protein
VPVSGSQPAYRFQQSTRRQADSPSLAAGFLFFGVHGIFKGGKIELLDPFDQPEGTPVLVTLPVQEGRVHPSELGISENQAAEMDVYDRL